MRLLSRLYCSLSALSYIHLSAALGPGFPKVRPGDVPTSKPTRHGAFNGQDFVQWIQDQVEGGNKTFSLAEGHYHVNPMSDPVGSHISLSGLSDVILWMDSVNLTMTDSRAQAFAINNCSNLVTYGPAAVWWDTPGFPQATITAVKSEGANGKDFDVQFHLDDGYNSSHFFSDGQFSGKYIDPKTGRMQAGPGWSMIEGTATRVDGSSNTFTVPAKGLYFTPLVGHKLLARGDFLFCNHVEQNNNTIIDDYTLLNCGGFGWMSSSNRKTTFNSYSLIPAPFPPPGGIELPAWSSSADGIHSGGDFVGPTFDSCLFSSLDDDCIAVHGSSENITHVDGNTFTPTSDAEEGDILNLYTADWNPLGNSIVTGISGKDTFSISVKSMPSGVTEEGHWVNQDRVGSGFAIRNVHTTGNRGRRFIIKASNGVIENYVIEGPS